MTLQRSGLCAFILAMALLGPGTLLAQSARESRVEIGAGLGWFGGVRFADVNATETAPGGGRNVLFASSSQIDGSASGGTRVGIRLTRWLRAEASLAIKSTRLTTRISNDFERAPDLSASEPVIQYLVETGLLARPVRWRRGRLEPFATASVGYLRQVNDGRTLIETGRSHSLGGGATYALRSRRLGRVKSAGLRADIRAIIPEVGVGLQRERHAAPFFGASLFAGF